MKWIIKTNIGTLKWSQQTRKQDNRRENLYILYSICCDQFRFYPVITSFLRILRAKSTTGMYNKSFLIGGIFIFLYGLKIHRNGIKINPRHFNRKAAIRKNTSILWIILYQIFELLSDENTITLNSMILTSLTKHFGMIWRIFSFYFPSSITVEVRLLNKGQITQLLLKLLLKLLYSLVITLDISISISIAISLEMLSSSNCRFATNCKNLNKCK